MSVNVKFRIDRNKWQVTCWQNGKRKRPLFETEQEARNFARLVMAGALPKKSSITIELACKEYFDEVSKHKSRTSKCNDRRYLNLLIHFLTEERGLTYLEDVKLQDLEAFQHWSLETKRIGDDPLDWSEVTVNRAFNTIRHVFKKHVQWGKLANTPCACLDDLEGIENERRPLTHEEAIAALEHSPKWFRPALAFIHLTGAPPSCVERLTFKDIDFVKRKFWLLRKKGRKVRRIEFQMIEPVFEILMRQKNRFDVGPVFRNKSGAKFNADWISDVGNAAIDRAGLPEDAYLYGLRHSLASDMVNANVSLEIIRAALGHADIKTTQRYAKAESATVSSALTLVRGGAVAG
jgi:site-specific recombinase XerD